MLEYALPMAKNIAALKQRAKQVRIPPVYVNDNFGKWPSDFTTLLRHCLDDNVCGKPLVELLQPEPDDYFVLKPKHSGFFSTTLDTLLEYLQRFALACSGLAVSWANVYRHPS